LSNSHRIFLWRQPDYSCFLSDISSGQSFDQPDISRNRIIRLSNCNRIIRFKFEPDYPIVRFRWNG
jgi:hypothetical protein